VRPGVEGAGGDYPGVEQHGSGAQQAFAVTDRTRIGSPFVIAAMNAQLAKGIAPVVGYEANGGFLLGSPLGTLAPLPTRDAVLPVLAVIVASRPGRIRDLLDALPPRVTYSDRIQNFATERSEAILRPCWKAMGRRRSRG
jgi:phosphomannomutase